jgi:hypothetical protein
MSGPSQLLPLGTAEFSAMTPVPALATIRPPNDPICSDRAHTGAGVSNGEFNESRDRYFVWAAADHR